MTELIIKLRKRFCKDMGLSMNLFDEPFFTNRLELMDMKNDYYDFLENIKTRYNGNIEEFFSDYNKTKDTAINYIKESEGFKALNSDDMNKYAVKTNISTSNVFKDSNVGMRFISIDVVKANFSCLVQYSTERNLQFHNNFNYNDFIGKFTDNEHFIKSKYIRQVIFGNCNPKRSVTYSKYLIYNVLQDLLRDDIIKESDIYSMAADEIVIRCDFNDEKVDKIFEYTNNINNTKVPLRTTYFKLGKVVNTEAYAKLMFPENKIELKCVNPIDAPAIYRYVKGLERDSEDLYFHYDGRLAKLMEHKDIKIVYSLDDMKE